jgi:hypothetical protein
MCYDLSEMSGFIDVLQLNFRMVFPYTGATGALTRGG